MDFSASNSRGALTDLGNIQQRRRKVAQTYGKNHGRLAKSQQMQHSIFGHDSSEIENQLSKLSLKELDPKKSSLNTPKKRFVQKTLAKGNSGSCSPEVLPDSRRGRPLGAKRQSANSTLDSLFSISGSDEVESFISFGNKIAKRFTVEKIGEGSFAEVFKITSSSAASFTSQKGSNQLLRAIGVDSDASSSLEHYTSIIKVIPLSGPGTSASILDRCSSVASVSHEINILKQLDPVHGFTRFRGLRLVKGLWPDSFLEAYRDFRKHHRKRAINAPPDQDFDEDQVYALVEMDDAGSEISLIKRPSVFQVWDIFWISTILLANAEECIEFEHRDLHMSNICVKSARQQIHTQDGSESRGKPASPSIVQSQLLSQTELDIQESALKTMTVAPDQKIGLSNLRVTVIDYTVARACLPTEDVEVSPSKSSKSKFISTHKSINSVKSNCDTIIFDPMTFTSDPFVPNLSDIESHLQNLTYAKTRAIAIFSEKANTPPTDNHSRNTNFLSSPTQHNKWRAFIPKTNVVWLGYLLRMLIHKARGRTGKLHILKGKAGKGGNSKLVTQLQEQMWETLLEVSKLLNCSDYREIEEQGDGRNKKTMATTTHEQVLNIDGSGNALDLPCWTDEELDELPESSLGILEMAVQSGWVSADDIQAFRTVLEDESS